MSELSSLIVSILPYAIGAAITPEILTFTMDTFSPIENPRLQLFSYYFGSIMILIFLIIMGMFIGSSISSNILGPVFTGAIMEIFLGGIFIILALNTLLMRKEFREDGFFGFVMSLREDNDLSIFVKFLYMGVLVILANLATALLILGAGNVVGLANPGFWIAAVTIIIFGIIALLVIEIPLIFYLARPGRYDTRFSSFYDWLTNYGNYLAFIVLLIIGIFFIARGTVILYY